MNRKRITTTEAMERRLSEPPPVQRYILDLFVTGSTPSSIRAIRNLRRICQERLNGNYELRIVDIYQQPELARDHQIVAAPTLVKRLPAPVRRIIGDMSNETRVLSGLGLLPSPSVST